MPRIFISYRRDDSRTITGRIYDRLSSQFGKENVFRDLDGIALGSDFRRVIEREVSSCDFLLAIIGSHWVTITDGQGRKRIDDPGDFVRIEVEAALRLPNVTVIPVYVDGVRGITAADLPPTLAELPYRNAAVVRDDPDFHGDVDKLIGAIKSLVTADESLPVPPPSRARLDSKLWIGLLALIIVIAAIASVANNLRQSAGPTATPTAQAAVAPSSTSTDTPVPTLLLQPISTVTMNYQLDETATQIMLQRTADAKAATNEALFAESTHIAETAKARPIITLISETTNVPIVCQGAIASLSGSQTIYTIYSDHSLNALRRGSLEVGTVVYVTERYVKGREIWLHIIDDAKNDVGWIEDKYLPQCR